MLIDAAATIIAALVGGVLAGLLTNAIATSKRQRRHEARVRHEVAHETARPWAGECVARIVRWADAVAYDVVGSDVDFFDPEGTPADLTPRAALADLRLLRTSHPTAEVRDLAKELGAFIAQKYGEYDPNRVCPYPDSQVLEDREPVLKTLKMAEGLIEVVHSPPPDDRARSNRASRDPAELPKKRASGG